MANYPVAIALGNKIMPLLIQLEHIKLLRQMDFMLLISDGDSQEIVISSVISFIRQEVQ